MFGLTPLGVVHTLISLVAVGAGLYALVRDKAILPGTGVGRLYVWTTLITVLTGFGIFQHGGFGNAHVLGVVTLVVMAVAWHAGRGGFGGWAPYVATVSWSATFLFHWIPAITETTTRLPLGAPLLPGPEAPELQVVAAALFVLFLIGASLQVLRLRRRGALAT